MGDYPCRCITKACSPNSSLTILRCTILVSQNQLLAPDSNAYAPALCLPLPLGAVLVFLLALLLVLLLAEWIGAVEAKRVCAVGAWGGCSTAG
jgi:hypothetical protein